MKAIWLAVPENVRKANPSVKRNGHCSACLSSTLYSKMFSKGKETLCSRKNEVLSSEVERCLSAELCFAG